MRDSSGSQNSDLPPRRLLSRPEHKPQVLERKPRCGFTIIEVMIAIAIFAMVITAIYSTWMAILRGSRSGLNAAAAVQRSRIAMRTVEDALLTAEMFAENLKYYGFVVDTGNEDAASFSMVSRLPASFPGVGRYGDQIVRRVGFFTQPGTDGANELVMTQAPMLLDPEGGVEPYSLVLARDVTLFRLEFWDTKKQEWATEWVYTNQLPQKVRVSLGLGKTKGYSPEPLDAVTRVIALPATVVAGLQAGPLPGAPGQPRLPGQTGVPLPGSLQPGQPGYQPGLQKPYGDRFGK